MSSLGNKEVFSKNLRYYMALHSETRIDICDKLGFPYTTFVGWETAKTYPRIDKIELLARHFAINKSDLIEDKSAEQVKKEPAANNGGELAEIDIELISLLRALTPEQAQRAKDFVRGLLASR